MGGGIFENYDSLFKNKELFRKLAREAGYIFTIKRNN